MRATFRHEHSDTAVTFDADRIELDLTPCTCFEPSYCACSEDSGLPYAEQSGHLAVYADGEPIAHWVPGAWWLVGDLALEHLQVLADEPAVPTNIAGDPTLAVIEDTAANLALLATGTWGEGTRTLPADDTTTTLLRHLDDAHGIDPNTVEPGDEDSRHEQEHTDSPRVQVLHVRDPDSACSVEVYLDDTLVPAEVADVDPGASGCGRCQTAAADKLDSEAGAFAAATAAARREAADCGHAAYDCGGHPDEEEEPTWTFCGRWNGADQIVVDYVVPGCHDDDRTGGDLWAAAASGRTVTLAQVAAVAEYQDLDHDHDTDLGPTDSDLIGLRLHLSAEHGYYDAEALPADELAEAHRLWHNG